MTDGYSGIVDRPALALPGWAKIIVGTRAKLRSGTPDAQGMRRDFGVRGASKPK